MQHRVSITRTTAATCGYKRLLQDIPQPPRSTHGWAHAAAMSRARRSTLCGCNGRSQCTSACGTWRGADSAHTLRVRMGMRYPATIHSSGFSEHSPHTFRLISMESLTWMCMHIHAETAYRGVARATWNLEGSRYSHKRVNCNVCSLGLGLLGWLAGWELSVGGHEGQRSSVGKLVQKAPHQQAYAPLVVRTRLSNVLVLARIAAPGILVWVCIAALLPRMCVLHGAGLDLQQQADLRCSTVSAQVQRDCNAVMYVNKLPCKAPGYCDVLQLGQGDL